MKSEKESRQGLPFQTEQLLKAVDESSKRSRSILLMLTFTSFIIFMAWINSLQPEFNWFKSTIELKKDINQYIVFPADSMNKTAMASPPLDNFYDYIIQNESLFFRDSILPAGTISFAKKMNTEFPLKRFFRIQNPASAPVLISSYAKRKSKYQEIGKSVVYMYDHSIFDRASLLAHISKLEDSKTEHLDLIRVPILGISFHVNYLGVYGGFILTVLLILFYFSLLREKINLKITFSRGWVDLKHHHYFLYEYASMLQVLSIPKKLFASRKKKNITYLIFSKIAMFLPLFTYLLVFLYDVRTMDIGNETNSRMTQITIFSDTVFLFAICYFSWKAHKQWQQHDMLWENQVYEFNLEYIMEATGLDPEEDLVRLFPPKISSGHLNLVKHLWYKEVTERYPGKKKVSKKQASRMLNSFINNVFKMEPAQNQMPENQEWLDKAWLPLYDWFNAKGKKNVNSSFRNTLCDTVNFIRADIQQADHESI